MKWALIAYLTAAAPGGPNTIQMATFTTQIECMEALIAVRRPALSLARNQSKSPSKVYTCVQRAD